ncbi:DegV family protein [Fervidibacillus halotolerans]|uniref:DegV family protein n=1 Tax=Fervidibacillus halotolerans TaxID=2980027 RepID=A0A9E8S113_9BACI|nr:DegV family protein [Fervidibacillus halotolerans]WAA13052.1 DegV family protein [Fervidibacillus halotolerans]
MNNVKLIADSGSDLPLDFFHEHSITFIPLRVHLDGEEYEDLVTIDPKVIYDGMRKGKVPKTSQASPDQLKKEFTKLAEDEQPAIYITFSSQLSGTYQLACMIRDQVLEEYPDFDLTIIDSKCASLGYGLVVMKVAELIEAGLPKDVIIEEAQWYSRHMEHLFTVDNLEYLYRGGRVSKATAFVGGLLNIKPLLNVEDGKLVPLEKHRGRKKLFNRIIELMKERGDDLQNQTIAISHGDDEQSALELKELVEEKLGCKNFYINMIGSAIGSHSGPGTLAIFFLNQKK